MKHFHPGSIVAFLAVVITSSHLSAQDLRTFNQNASRSNHTRLGLTDNWNFGINSGGSFGLKSNENTLFRGNSMATKMFGKYYFGNVGLGFTNGIIPGSINDGALNSFIVDRKFPQDQLQVTNTKPFNSYFLFGPSVRFGKRVEIGADAQAGMFINNPGAVTIGQQGAQRALYRFDGGDKNLFPGFSGGIQVAYPINQSTRFFVNTDYVQSRSSVRLYDPQQGIDVPTQQNRDLKLFTAGVGIVKSFGTKRDAASGRATGKRLSRDAASGMATGRRILNHNTTSPRDAASGLATGRRSPSLTDDGGFETTADNNGRTGEYCGTTSHFRTLPDGTIEEIRFSCPSDAAAYARMTNNNSMPGRLSMTPTTTRQTQGSTFGEKVATGLQSGAATSRLSMTPTTTKQTQGSNFGEKVAGGLQSGASALSQGASRGIISGNVSWTNENSDGIITNEMAAKSSVGNLAGSGSGAASASYAAGRVMNTTNDPQATATTIYARDAATGRASGKRSREAGSGLATGRRQYEPVSFGEGNTNCTGCVVTAKQTAHELAHVIQQSSTTKSGNPLYSDGGLSGSNPMHERKSGSGGLCGTTDHFLVILVNTENGQPVAKTKTDSCGNFWFANVPAGDYAVRVKADVIVKDSYDVNINKEGKYDIAGEMIADDQHLLIKLTGNISDKSDGKSSGILTQGASLLGGAMPGASVVSSAFVAGNPIGGIIVKGGKNPGGNLMITQTNEYGEFEFTDLKKGNYTISTELMYSVDETVSVRLDLDSDNDGYNERKGWDGTVKSGSKASVQDHNSSRSNKSASFINDNTGGSNEPDRQARKLKGKVIKTGDNGMIQLDAGEPVTFRWTPVVPKPKETTSYRLRVWQLMQGQNGTQAMRSGQPLVDKTVSGISEVSVDNLLTGPCKPPYLCDFIWSAQVIGSNGNLIGKEETGTFGTNQTKAQNNNTVRSNRTELKSILVEADTDGDGVYETDVTNRVNDAIFIDENGNVDLQQKAGISTSRSNIRTRSSLEVVSEGLFVSYGTAFVGGNEVSVKSVLKASHDMQMGAIRNMK